MLVFHACPAWLPGGFFGVDVFFVLSGYLITSVILVDRERDRFTLREFWLRRVQRLVPNVVATVLFTLVVTWLFLPRSLVGTNATHAMWVLGNLSNVWLRLRIGGYWAPQAGALPLLHTWSLAVEEQLYLAFPLVLLLRRPRAIVVGLTIASLALSVLRAAHHPESTFYFLPMRAWQPLLGACLAFVVRARPVELPAIVGCLSLVIVVGTFVLVGEVRYARPGVPFLPTLAAVLLVASTRSPTHLTRSLTHPALVTVGRLSYSLYLWHWPPLVLGRTWAQLVGRSPRTGQLVGLAVGLVLGVVAFYVVEQPLRRRGPGRARRLSIIGVGWALTLGLALAMSRARVVPDAEHVFEPVEYDGESYSAKPVPEAQRSRHFDDVVHTPEVPRAPGSLVHAWGSGPPEVVLLGDSHALMYAHVVDMLCEKAHVSVAFVAADGASPIDATIAFHPRVVLVAARWEREPDLERRLAR